MSKGFKRIWNSNLPGIIILPILCLYWPLVIISVVLLVVTGMIVWLIGGRALEAKYMTYLEKIMGKFNYYE